MKLEMGLGARLFYVLVGVFVMIISISRLLGLLEYTGYFPNWLAWIGLIMGFIIAWLFSFAECKEQANGKRAK